jgi:hypothetical protein
MSYAAQTRSHYCYEQVDIGRPQVPSCQPALMDDYVENRVRLPADTMEEFPRRKNRMQLLSGPLLWVTWSTYYCWRDAGVYDTIAVGAGQRS